MIMYKKFLTLFFGALIMGSCVQPVRAHNKFVSEVTALAKVVSCNVLESLPFMGPMVLCGVVIYEFFWEEQERSMKKISILVGAATLSIPALMGLKHIVFKKLL